jgi:hypothetical protein
VRLLGSLAPRPGQAALIEEIFRRTWNAKNNNDTELAAQMNRLEGLKARKQRVLLQMEEGNISEEDFKSRYDQLEGLINAASVQIEQMKNESGLDVDTALDYLSHLLWNASILWETSDLDTKQRLQRAIFPGGLKYDPKHGFGTVSTDFFSMASVGESAPVTDVASPTGFEPVLPP